MAQKHLKSLECLCVKAASSTLTATGSTVKATLSCKASVKTHIIASSKMFSPGKFCQSLSFIDAEGTGPVYSLTLATPASAFLAAGDTATIEKLGQTYEYAILSVSGTQLIILYKIGQSAPDTPVSNLCTTAGGGNDTETCIIKLCSKGDQTPPRLVRSRVASALLNGLCHISSKLSAGLNVNTSLSAVGKVNSGLTVDYIVRQKLNGGFHLTASRVDKFAGDFGDFSCVEKLYPSGDLPIDSGMGRFVGKHNASSDLYRFIDEGVFTGDYDKPFGNSLLISDDMNSFIHPDTYHTDGLFQYKCNLTNFLVRPEDTRLRIRASAPISNYEANVPPKYTIRNIKFQDPSGNLIVKYEDIIVYGDVDYSNEATHANFSTYSSAAETNRADLYDWQRTLPHMYEISGYKLTFDVRSEALDDPFDPGFDFGFEENYTIHDTYASGDDYLALDGAPLSTQDQSLINPTKGVRISAIEICNSGGYGPRPENYISLFAQVPEKGRRLERKIFPSFMPLAEFDTGVWPSVSSVWYHKNSGMDDAVIGSNLDSCGTTGLVSAIQQDTAHDYAELHSTGPHLDSGKLTLKFSHAGGMVNEITEGAFDCGFDQSTCPTWFDPSGAFNSQNRTPLGTDDGFFEIESITLKVKARKAVGSRDYVLDVVGHSDDGLLNVSSAPSGFLQNPYSVQINDQVISSEGVHPVTSGFLANGDDLAIAAESLSEKERYVETSGNLGGDHYSLTAYPTVTTTDFADYEVPLKIYDDLVTLGVSRDYGMSSLFEHLYVDVYPLPSGASIASVYLLVRYKPQNALKLSVEGGERIRKIQDGRSEGQIYPTMRGSTDDMLNAGSGYGPISNIENVPHAYTTPSSIKSNYSRRWRGMEGTVQGPFDPDMFGFGFENPLLDFPFLSGFYDFDHMDGLYVKSHPLGSGFGNVSGLFNTAPEIYKNIGWRFSSGTLFNDQLPGYSGAYKTSDWTSLASGAINFEDDQLYGQIADAFNNVVRISGHSQSINFGNIDTASGFSIFTRFTPDVNTSGVDYNLFNSGVLFSKWGSASDLDFALGYSDGFLCGYSKDIDGNVITVTDTLPYSGYQFPLSVILTYNDHDGSGLKLYTENEADRNTFTHDFEDDFDGDHLFLRASSIPFYKNTTNADLVVGHCSGSGVGMNMLLSEFGISTYTSGARGSGTNIVEADPDLTYKQVTAETFFDNHRAKFYNPDEAYHIDTFKLWNYVDENTYSDWDIGAFKYCEFSMAFSHLTKRTGRDLIGFNIKHDGSGYITRNDLALPSNIDSGVSYHTQIENDFLRFHLSDTADNFHSTQPRITKDLPRGYVFADRALVVETVMEHKTDHNIVWPDCTGTVGPKLIVSLYTKRKEPYWVPNESNWGLINRDIHYLEPSSCIMRLDSKFTYSSLMDTSEQWALFPKEPLLGEFSEKYYSQDVDDMFLQYDLVYPSGSPFESRINIHTSHVRLDNAYVTGTEDADSNATMRLIASGGNVVAQNLDLFLENYPESDSGILNLFATGPTELGNSGLVLYTSGSLRELQSLHLNTLSYVSSSSGINLNVSGKYYPITDGSGSFRLNVEGLGLDSAIFPLSIRNNDLSYVPSGGLLPLFTYSTSGTVGVRDTMPMVLINTHSADPTASSSSLNLVGLGSTALIDTNPDVSMSLFIEAPSILSENMNLVLYGDDFITSTTSSSGTSDPVGGTQQLGLNLVIANYGGVGSDYFNWFNYNYGTGIAIEDNVYATLPVGNEIRGVDLIGYGHCLSDSPRKAIDKALVTDDTIWRPETCNDGGIFRAVDLYTNSGAVNFSGGIGYSGNYYGIRKYTDLIPHSPYWATMKITTGSTDAIKVPRTFEEWEYGMCGPDFYSDSGCCTADCDQNLVFSGAKMIGDYPYMSGDLSLTPTSGRNEDDQYGKSVAVMNDLMAVASPRIELLDESGYMIPDAGSVFVYRRGADVAGKKADWQRQDQLMLPSGFRRDYVSKIIQNLVSFDQFTISGQKWNIGQEGRRFGSSLDIGASGDRETVVIGAPFAGWSRTFPTITTSGIPVCMIAFVDKFQYSEQEVSDIANAARKWDILYKYFSAPWNAQTSEEFQPRLNIKVLVYQLAYDDDEKPPVIHNNADWFYHGYIPRMDDPKLRDQKQATHDEMMSGIRQGFFTMFPSGSSTFSPHSGVPPIMGLFEEDSPSAGHGAVFLHNEVSVVDEFADFYKSYSYASGVINPVINSPVDTPASGYINRTAYSSEGWASTSVDLINETLDSGYLINNDVLDFITSGVGQEWAKSDAYEFQIPPGSGGRVYVFEKESGVFNCVQEIKSIRLRDALSGPDELMGYGHQYNDRFGHSVGISQNSQVISVGSPYTAIPCEVFERNDSENQRMYKNLRSWLTYRGLDTEVDRYDSLVTASGEPIAQTTSYHELSHSNKFWLRTDENFWGNAGVVDLYKPIYQYAYSDITSTGTWRFILDEFAGTSRLGYSTSVSDDGDIVAFGAPTDSTTLFEDTNIWYKGKDTWASYTNAGAVRMFESRKYVPHSGVIEFTRFGNLDRATHETERNQGFYDQMGLYFQPDDRFFRRTEFSEIEIPRNVGLAFVITPELDAASDEIVDNIKRWLALGDRTLVLVGNDPVYEENGLYSESNKIVNKILGKLGSRMRIHPAATEYESLQGCVSESDVFNDRWNVTKSFVPAYAHTKYDGYKSTISRDNIFAKGVGDIKMDVSGLALQDMMQWSPCDPLNKAVCNLPLRHNGDLRAEWKSECEKTAGKQKIKVKYLTNWGFHFANTNPARLCDFYPEDPHPLINRPYEDVAPILTAAEFLPEECWYLPPRSGVRVERSGVYKKETRVSSTTVIEFAEQQLDEIAFDVVEDSDSNLSGIYTYFDINDNKGGFIDPDAQNGRDALLQGVGTSELVTTVETVEETLAGESVLALREKYTYADADDNTVDDNNNVFLISHLNGENQESFTDGVGNSDENIFFYVNLVKPTCSEAPHIVQLGGWTKRESFASAYSGSVLKDRLEAYINNDGVHGIVENAIYDAGEDIPPHVDVVWIANPDGQPDDGDISVLKNWLESGIGNRKLVITYSGTNKDTRQGIAENVNVLCEKLGISSRPFKRPCKGDYYVQGVPLVPSEKSSTQVSQGNNLPCCPYQPGATPFQKVNDAEDSIKGCSTGYGFHSSSVDTGVTKLSLREGDNKTAQKFDYIPISGGGNFEKIVYYEDSIVDYCPHVSTKTHWYIEGNASGLFPVEEGSGYRVFASWVSDTTNEKFELAGHLESVSRDADSDEDHLAPEGESVWFNDPLYFNNTPAHAINSTYLDVRARASGIEVVFDTDRYRRPRGIIPSQDGEFEGFPLTPRILSVSGCPLPIETTVTTTTEDILVFSGWLYTYHPWYVPASSGCVAGVFRPIKHKSEPYCNPSSDCESRGNGEIEDGPVVAAEEFEHFSSFAAGSKRSKIVVLSDSTMIQGQCPQYRSDALNENQKFIRSLYPTSPHEAGTLSNLNDGDENTGRQFEFTQKLRAPERGSAAKYYAVSGIADTIDPLYAYGGVSGGLSKYVDNEDTYHPASPGFTRDPDPVGGAAKKQAAKEFGLSVVPTYGQFPRFSGDFLNQGSYTIDGIETPVLLDAGLGGGLPDLMKLGGTDYLDFDLYTSGCPGDLFGFSVDLSQSKLAVGTPFNGFYTEGAISGVSGIVQWHEIENDPSRSGMRVSQNGGAGAAFYFERTGSGSNVVSEFLPWEFKQKIKPSSINVGLDGCTSSQLQLERGDHNLNGDFILDNAGRTDKFGYSVAIDADMIAVGAPHHDFETLHDHIYSGTSAFQRKSFNAEFEIPGHKFHDLGGSGVRYDQFGDNSGVMVLNNGAVFNYRHEITDWSNRAKEWRYADKLYAQGYLSRIGTTHGVGGVILVSGCENDAFGQSVALHRSERGDSDYTLAVGAPFHDHPTSGNHITSGLLSAGAAYTYDAMLREQLPSIPNQGSWIDVEILGDKAEDGNNRLTNRVYQNVTGVPISYLTSGIIFSNANGDIFIEASGFDPSTKGFVAHRPYVEYVTGDLLPGTPVNATLRLFVSGVPVPNSGSMNLVLSGVPSAYVYNSMELLTVGCSGLSSGSMPLYVEAPSGIGSGVLNLNVTSTQTTEQLNLRLRGK